MKRTSLMILLLALALVACSTPLPTETPATGPVIPEPTATPEPTQPTGDEMTDTDNTYEFDPNFYIYLAFGQSNMEGAANIEVVDMTVDPRFEVLQSLTCYNYKREANTWYPATPPLCQCYSGLTPADYFGRTMVVNLPEEIGVGIINVAIGGSDIRLFDKDLYQNYTNTYEEAWFQDKIKAYGGNPYQHLINLATLAQQRGVIKGILLHQGETNTGDQQWPEYVEKIYRDMLTDLDLNADDVPLLAGEVVGKDQDGVCAAHNPIINTLPETIPTAHVISSKGCTHRGDNVHFDSAGVRELGTRYATTMLTLMGLDTIVDTEGKLLVRDGKPLISTGFKTLDYLISISGEKTLAGQHNREPNAEPALWTEWISETTGTYPALWSGDFLFQQDNIDNRWTMIHEAKKQWDQGAVINLMWHACPPDEGEPCQWDPGLLNAQLDDGQWEALLTEGSDLNEVWKIRMDDIAVYLQYLEDEGVEVLFRPFHEMNQGLFWWGGRPGPDGTTALYRYTHDYLTHKKGLTNLIWVWDMQDMSWDFEDYNPGDDYWDVFAFDIYDNGYDRTWYETILPIVGDKPMAIGECSKLPTSAILVSQPRWTFFMPWAEHVKEANTEDAIRRLYKHDRVLTLDEMPGWGD